MTREYQWILLIQESDQRIPVDSELSGSLISYPLSLIPYPLSLIPYPLSLIPYPLSLIQRIPVDSLDPGK